MLITRGTVIGDLLDNNPEFEDILLENGMHCFGCPASRGETVEEACEVHEIDVDALLVRLNSKK